MSFVLHIICTVTPPHTIKPLVKKIIKEIFNVTNYETIDIIDQWNNSGVFAFQVKRMFYSFMILVWGLFCVVFFLSGKKPIAYLVKTTFIKL